VSNPGTREGFLWALAHEVHKLVRAGRDAAAVRLVPEELPFALPAAIAERQDCKDR
jgi:hypothetical protein